MLPGMVDTSGFPIRLGAFSRGHGADETLGELYVPPGMIKQRIQQISLRYILPLTLTPVYRSICQGGNAAVVSAA